MKRFAVCVLLGLATTLPIVGCAEKPPAQDAPAGTEAKAPESEAKPAESTGDHKEGDAAAPAAKP